MTGICKRCGEQVCSCDLVDDLGEPLERQLRKRVEQLEQANVKLHARLDSMNRRRFSCPICAGAMVEDDAMKEESNE